MWIDLKNLDFTKVTNMVQMFSGCTSLSYINFDFNEHQRKQRFDELCKKRQEKLKRVLNNAKI